MPAFSHTPLALRPREKLLAQGPQHLNVEELITLVLGSGISQYPVDKVAKEILTVLRTSQPTVADLLCIPGIGVAKATELIAALTIGDRVRQLKENAFLHSAEDIYNACTDLLDKPQEHLVAFFLTVRNQVLKREVISIGTLTASLIHPREVFREAIRQNASHIFLAHNHPSGFTTPSSADLQVTRSMVQAGECIGIQVIDHVICAVSGYTSLQKYAPKLFIGI